MGIERLSPKAVERPWGGTRLEKLITDKPSSGRIGELYVHDGSRPPGVLIKWIDAAEVLSLQNHPSKPGYSKREVWYFVEPPDGEEVITGVRCEIGDPEIASKLEMTKAERGSILELPAGRIHALTAGALVVEIQEPLDITYRIHDWGRGREVHIDEARGALSIEPIRSVSSRPFPSRYLAVDRAEFRVEVIDGSAEIVAAEPGVATFVMGSRLGENYRIDGGSRFTIASDERALWITKSSG